MRTERGTALLLPKLRYEYRCGLIQYEPKGSRVLPPSESPAFQDAADVDLPAAYLDDLDEALFLCEVDRLSVLWLNIRARELTEGGGRLAMTGNRLVGATPAHTTRLLAMAKGTGGAIILTAESRLETLIVRIKPLCGTSGPRMVAVTAFNLAHTASFILPDLRETFDLTPAEQRVLVGLTAGHTAIVLASMLNVTLETARTHIRRIYAKMGVSSREELIFLAGQYRVP